MSETLSIAGRELEQRWWGAPVDGAPTIVLLHEGLGCIEQWRDIPDRLNAETGVGVYAYSRYGYGRSTPFAEPRTPRYMHDEALETLPAVLAAAGIDDPILVGHSDGGSIALIYAGERAGPVRAIATLAAHSFVEEKCVVGIAGARDAVERSQVVEKLARYHRDPAATFWGWCNIWLDPDFQDWNLTEHLGGITCPALVLQGVDDQYGTEAMVDHIAGAVGGPVETAMIADCGHIMHRDQPDEIVARLTTFIRSTM